MASTLDNLSENLSKVKCNRKCNCLKINFKKTFDVFQNTGKIKEIKKKGFYRYEYIDSYENINDKKLPSIDKFYSRLTGKIFPKKNI